MKKSIIIFSIIGLCICSCTPDTSAIDQQNERIHTLVEEKSNELVKSLRADCDAQIAEMTKKKLQSANSKASAAKQKADKLAADQAAKEAAALAAAKQKAKERLSDKNSKLSGQDHNKKLEATKKRKSKMSGKR